MRTATGSRGEEWEVFVEWEGRKPLHNAFRRLRAHREAAAQKRGESRKGNMLDGCDPLSGIGDELGAVVLIFVLVTILILFGPWIFAVLLGIIELAAIVLVVLFGLVGRTLFRRPWRVAAVSDTGAVWAWQQVGFAKSRRLVHEIADALDAGRAPNWVAHDRIEPDSPYQLGPDPDLGPMVNPTVRIAAMAFIVIATVTSIFVLIDRLF